MLIAIVGEKANFFNATNMESFNKLTYDLIPIVKRLIPIIDYPSPFLNTNLYDQKKVMVRSN